MKYPSATAVTAASLLAAAGSNPLAVNANWFVATGQMPHEPTPDVRQTAFYLGMQLEELCEKLDAVFGAGKTEDLADFANELKAGLADEDVARALKNPEQAKALLDGDVDLLWVTLGAIRAMGSDANGAHMEVGRANWAKRFPDNTFHRDQATGKVLKPEGWTPPDLTPYLHPSLRGGAA